ncbi:MAG: tRNA dihydrouridine synthase DusB [Alphaproteobacteria bacterium]|nr:tRNA dihydrouridine synthase DusB [Alphaproteobacteria bacterium]
MSTTVKELFRAQPVVLAPMAGVTDAAFRGAVSSYGAALVYSEMVASKELLSDRKGAALRFRNTQAGTRIAIQLAGRDPNVLAEAALMAEAEGALLIDINMGCPAKKVVGGLCGSALMREPQLARELVRAVVKAVSVPVTVKMRLGWDDADRNAPTLAKALQEEGVQAFAVHGRTRAQFYDGCADWQFIGEVKSAVSVPVLANGDVTTAANAIQILKDSGADGVMVGRGAFGRPWAIAQMQAAVRGQSIPPDPSSAERWQTALTHYHAALEHYGVELGRRVVRKHLGWYAERAGASRSLRTALVRSIDPEFLLAQLASGRSAEEEFEEAA